MLKNFIARLPIDTIKQVEIEDDKVTIPTQVNPMEFYKEHRTEVESLSLTPEKAIYLAASNSPKTTLSIKSLLIKGR